MIHSMSGGVLDEWGTYTFAKVVFDGGDGKPYWYVAEFEVDEGDKVLAPFGGGTKKVKEYLIDQKVPLRLRDSLPMLCCDNTVWAIAGMEIADAAKVTPQSRNVLAIRYTRGE